MSTTRRNTMTTTNVEIDVGSKSLIQSNFGNKGNFEVVVR